MDRRIYGGSAVIHLFLFFVLISSTASALSKNPNPSSGSGQINSNSVLVALLDSRYTELAELVEKALLLQTLEDAVGRHNITIFAPRNEALERDLDPEFKRFLLEPGNLKSLQTLLMFHIIPNRVGSDQWPPEESGRVKHHTLGNDQVHLSNGERKKMVDLAEIIRPDDLTRPDGLIHGIERLLIPRSVQEDFNRRRSLQSISAVLPEGAPEVDPRTNRLKKRAAPVPAGSPPALPIQSAMAPGPSLAPAPAPGPGGKHHHFDGDAQVKDFIHTLLHYGGYNEMADILVNLTSLATEMGRLVSEGYVLTVLAPNDEAMAKLTTDQLSEPGAPEQIVYYHIIPEYQTEESMYNSVRRFGKVKFETLRFPHKVAAKEADGSVKFGDGEKSAYLFDPDIYTDGRISVQGIDGVLFPQEEEVVESVKKPVKKVVQPRRGFSKSSKSNKTRKTTPSKIQAEATAITSLFNEITEILGSDVVEPDETTRVRSHVTGAGCGDGALLSCTKSVRENARMGFLGVNEEAQKGVPEEVDVSPVVHEITSVVRADDDMVSMEDRLEKLSFRFEPEIVDNVLKRCFKVPHLALRFFNWVKDKDGFSHRVGIYNTMLSIAGEARDLDMVDVLVKEMEKNACDKDIRTWTILISVYGKAKKIGKGLLVFEKMRKSGFELDAAAYNIMIRSLSIAGRGDLALEFYKEMIEKGITFRLRTYKMLLDCIVKSEKVDVVQSIADDMVRICEISEHDAFGYLLKSFCVSGKIKEALELIRELKNKEVCLDAKYFEILVKGLCRANRMVDALEIVDIMKRRKLDDSNVYGIIISGYLRQNDVSKALEQFEVIKKSGHLPRVSTYTEIMQHLFKLKQFEKGCNIFSEMIESGIEPDSVAITAVVAGHLGQNRVAEAWKVFGSMEEKGIKPTWKSYSIFVKELCRSSKYDEIIKLFNQMYASKIAIREDIFSWVISSMEKNGAKEKIAIIKEIQKKCNFYCQELNGSDKAEFRQEEELVGDYNHPQVVQQSALPPASSAVDKLDVQEICRVLSSSRDWERTQEALEKSAVQFTPELVVEVLRNAKIQGNAVLRFFAWVGKRNGYKHSTEAYNMSIKVAGCGKDFKQMRNLFYEMRRQGCLITQDTWAIMIMQYGRCGLTNIAIKTFKEMKDMGLIPSSSTFKCLITVLCQKKGRNVEEATKTFREMIRSGFVPDRELVQDYLGCLCEVGSTKEAKRCLDSLGKIGFPVPVAYSIYIRALCRIGKLEEALSELASFEGERSLLDQYTYGSIVHGLLQRGDLQKALDKVNSMKEIGIKPGVHVYTSLIVHFFKEKQLEKVLETCQKMEEESCEPSVVTYTAMICGYMSLGEVDEAWNAFRNMKEKGTSPDFKTYSKFINCLCQAGKSEDALKLLSEMLDKGIAPSTINFRTVFYGLNREGKQDLARIVLQKKSALAAQRKLHQTSGFQRLRQKSQTTDSVSLVP